MATNAFPEQTTELAALVRKVELDKQALLQPLIPCQLNICHGTCCHDGVYLSSEEASVVRSLVANKRENLQAFDIELPEQVVVYGRFRNIASGPKTATAPNPIIRDKVSDYPDHFPETRCVFLRPDAKCALQSLALQEGKPAWHYKPFNCWIHPLSFTRKQGRSLLTLHSRETDPHQFEDYNGFTSQTHCGRTCQGGTEGSEPAYQVLSAELGYLSEISGRDLLAELEDFD